MESIEQVLNINNNKEIILSTVLGMLVENAKDKGATHIVIEPERDNHTSTIYYILGGKLEAQCSYPAIWYTPLRGRIKVIGGLDIAERHKTQNGVGVIEGNNRRYDVSISSVALENNRNTQMKETLIIAFNDSHVVKYPSEDTKIIEYIKELYGQST